MLSDSRGMHTDHAVQPADSRAALVPEAGEDFVLSPMVASLTERALAYLEAGYPVHFSGPAGTGKTTMAFHVAAQLGRPVSLVHGSDEFSASDLVGRDSGYRKSSMVDNYISSVLKTEETMQVNWVDNRLTTACERGHTLIYDEFNRSRAEANNTLLSILEEGILNVPRSDGSGYIVVHPEFRLILTSNPVEYAGVHETQDALLDRLVTIEVGHYDRDTEVAITASKSGIAEDDAARLVDVARLLRSRDPGGHVPTVRSTITLAQVLARAEVPVDGSDQRFLAFAWDMFGRAIRRTAADRTDLGQHVVAELMRSVADRGPGGRRSGGGDAGRVKGTGGTTRSPRRTTKEASS